LELAEENRALRQTVEAHYVFSGIIAVSKVLRDVLELARRAAEKNSAVLILGESGTGKDLLARAIHFHSSRRSKPFIPINCGAIPENLIESEFFGHKKGAFTGADSNRRGCFEEVAGGTIFLDEIGEMPLDLQVKLLRVLEERKIRRIGENIERPVDFRILAATNRSLADMVKEGRFRQDLFYRLNVLTITIPPCANAGRILFPWPNTA
jgi:transcriptional regulator with PAS, ATPase and Fis domain